MKPTCKACKHFYDYGTSRGDCKRFPPTPLYDNGTFYSHHPEVDETNWCGEFQPIPEPPQEPAQETGGSYKLLREMEGSERTAILMRLFGRNWVVYDEAITDIEFKLERKP